MRSTAGGDGLRVKFRKLKKLLKEYGIIWDSSRGKGSHGVFIGLSHVTKLNQTYPLPGNQQDTVSPAYLKPLRRRFELTSDHGVRDSLFR